MQPIPFGKYLLVERLAQGGMAEVFRAVYQGAAGFEKQVAVKRILPVFDGTREFVAMFVDEARIASSLTHVNIVQVSDFGELDGSYYLAMELVDGVDLGRLREAASRRGLRIPVPIVAYIVAEAARGLAYAHEKRGGDGAPLGIVHRDVSPQNVLVSYAGEVKIADFGIAKATGKLHKTESGAVMGKIRYMSPEQINGEPLDGRSDVFALGTIFWELLVGAALWNGDNPGLVSDQVRHAKVDPPSRRGADVPPELDRICLKALARARDARHERAADLARELSTFVSERAPGLTREDVGALVGELVPRELEPPPPPNDATAQT
ncbi:MAG TPA: serine/threonine-protein kinase, partial [Polyangia bacterium]